MKRLLPVIVCFGLAACGGSQDSGIKTPDERLEEQLALADEQNAKDKESAHRFDEASSETEEAQKFDKANADHELKRATLNAVDCPNTLLEADLKTYKPGTAELKVTFDNEGAVKEAVLASPYADTTVGTCVLRAIESVRIKSFTGPEETVDWKVELPAPKKKEDPKKTPAKKG